MSPTTPAPSGDSDAPARFLREASRRALDMAILALPGRAEAQAAVAQTIRTFAQRHPGHPVSEWRVLFWSLLIARLDTHEHPHIAAPRLPGSFERLPDTQALDLLHQALRALPHGQRQLFLLRVREDFDLGTLARITAHAESAVCTQLALALRNLRTMLQGDAPPCTSHETRNDGAWLLRCRALLDTAAHPPEHTPPRPRDKATAVPTSPVRQPRAAARSRRWLIGLGVLAIGAGAAVALLPLLSPSDIPAEPPPAVVAAPTPLPPPRIAPSEDTPLAAPDFDLLLDAEDEALLDALEFHAWLAEEGLPR